MTKVPEAAPRRGKREPRSLAALIDSVLRYAAADLGSEEGMHDLRVACRRLEAGTRLNKGVLSKSRLRQARATAKTLRHAFDQARDLEVIAAELRGRPGLSEEFTTATLNASRAHTTSAESGKRLRALMARLASIRHGLNDADVPEHVVLAQALDGHIASFFDELDRLLPESTDEALHEARITTKKLRYEMEIAAPAFFRLPAQVKRLKRLQDVLGRHQDAAVGLRWAERLTPGDFESTAADRAVLMHYYDALRREQRARLRRVLTGWRARDMRGRFLKATGAAGAAPTAGPVRR